MVIGSDGGGERGHFCHCERELGRPGRVLDARWSGGSRDRDDDWGEREFPGQGDLLRADAVVGRHLGESGVSVAQFRRVADATQRALRQERDTERRAMLQLGQAR